MSKLNGNLRTFPETDLSLIVGGSAAPKKNFMPTEGQKLTGSAVVGAMGGVVAGAPGGPGGMLVGGLVGATVGIGGHMVTSYVNGGNRNNIPPTPKPSTMSCQSCHGSGGKK
ncbi:MAG TPA: hypothetical protein VK188_10035 [Holophaga sp.]|nr:hypothetical protein [Holophaga sp.]